MLTLGFEAWDLLWGLGGAVGGFLVCYFFGPRKPRKPQPR